jgi:hypothetical protein
MRAAPIHDDLPDLVHWRHHADDLRAPIASPATQVVHLVISNEMTMIGGKSGPKMATKRETIVNRRG